MAKRNPASGESISDEIYHIVFSVARMATQLITVKEKKEIRMTTIYTSVLTQFI